LILSDRRERLSNHLARFPDLHRDVNHQLGADRDGDAGTHLGAETGSLDGHLVGPGSQVGG
jgi:hypothetical protein